MIKDVMYSIVQALSDSGFFTSALWLYDGISLDNEIAPFSTVESNPTNFQTLDKQATEQGATYHMQIGVYASNEAELADLIHKVAKLLSKPITHYSTSGEIATDAGDTFRCEVSDAVPMPIDAVQNVTNAHRCYFDVSVHVNYKL